MPLRRLCSHPIVGASTRASLQTAGAFNEKGFGLRCAMCQRVNTRQTYVQWGRQSCSSGHEVEYIGRMMATPQTAANRQRPTSESICVDAAMARQAARSNAAHLFIEHAISMMPI